MTQLNSDKPLDESKNIVENETNKAINAKKSPWYLRWPAAVFQAYWTACFQSSLAWKRANPTRSPAAQSMELAQENRARHRFGNPAGGAFAYQYKATAAWPAVIAAYGTDFFVKLFTGYAITQGLNAAFNSDVLKETAVADSDKWLYSKRKLRVHGYEYDQGGNRTLVHSVDAQAEANQLKTYDTSGTDTKRSPSTLDPDDVLDYVGENANLRRGIEVTYAVLEKKTTLGFPYSHGIDEGLK